MTVSGSNDAARTAELSVAVCVITYKGGEGLRRLLESLIEQHHDGFSYRIIVVDNDPDRSAEPIVADLRNVRVPIDYQIEPEKGIPAARNRSIQVARSLDADVAAFIDDDEIAAPGWIAAHVRRLTSDRAEATTGPVEPIFPDDAPAWAETSGLFRRPEFQNGQRLQYATTANATLRLHAIRDFERPFSDDFQFTGGSDSYLFQTLATRGALILYERDALVFEEFPSKRLTMKWLMARSFRHGITLGRCDRLIHGFGTRTVLRILKGVANIAAGIAETVIFSLARCVRWRRGMTRIARGAGAVGGVFGITYKEYRR